MPQLNAAPTKREQAPSRDRFWTEVHQARSARGMSTAEEDAAAAAAAAMTASAAGGDEAAPAAVAPGAVAAAGTVAPAREVKVEATEAKQDEEDFKPTLWTVSAKASDAKEEEEEEEEEEEAAKDHDAMGLAAASAVPLSKNAQKRAVKAAAWELRKKAKKAQEKEEHKKRGDELREERAAKMEAMTVGRADISYEYEYVYSHCPPHHPPHLEPNPRLQS